MCVSVDLYKINSKVEVYSGNTLLLYSTRYFTSLYFYSNTLITKLNHKKEKLCEPVINWSSLWIYLLFSLITLNLSNWFKNVESESKFQAQQTASNATQCTACTQIIISDWICCSALWNADMELPPEKRICNPTIDHHLNVWENTQ